MCPRTSIPLYVCPNTRILLHICALARTHEARASLLVPACCVCVCVLCVRAIVLCVCSSAAACCVCVCVCMFMSVCVWSEEDHYFFAYFLASAFFSSSCLDLSKSLTCLIFSNSKFCIAYYILPSKFDISETRSSPGYYFLGPIIYLSESRSFILLWMAVIKFSFSVNS